MRFHDRTFTVSPCLHNNHSFFRFKKKHLCDPHMITLHDFNVLKDPVDSTMKKCINGEVSLNSHFSRIWESIAWPVRGVKRQLCCWAEIKNDVLDGKFIISKELIASIPNINADLKDRLFHFLVLEKVQVQPSYTFIPKTQPPIDRTALPIYDTIYNLQEDRSVMQTYETDQPLSQVGVDTAGRPVFRPISPIIGYSTSHGHNNVNPSVVIHEMETLLGVSFDVILHQVLQRNFMVFTDKYPTFLYVIHPLVQSTPFPDCAMTKVIQLFVHWNQLQIAIESVINTPPPQSNVYVRQGNRPLHWPDPRG